MPFQPLKSSRAQLKTQQAIVQENYGMILEKINKIDALINYTENKEPTIGSADQRKAGKYAAQLYLLWRHVSFLRVQ